jgi:purine catabolism regulator
MFASILTLQQLLRVSFANSVIWLRQPPQKDAHVHWVVLTTEDIGPGDVLLIPGSEITEEHVKRLEQDGGTAIISWGEAKLVVQTVLSEIPIAVIPVDQEFQSVYRTLLTILINQRAYLMERGVRIHTHLSKIEAEGEGITGLVMAMSEISGRGVIVQDKRLRILAECSSSTLHSIWEDILDFLNKPDNLPKILRDRKQAGQNASVIQQSIPGDIARIVNPIVVGGVARGYLSLIGLEGEFDALDNLVIEQGALVCGIDMARSKAVREAEKRVKGDLLSAILYESLTPRDAHLWLESIGLDLNLSHVGLRFAWDADETPSIRRLETLVNGEISRQNYKAIVNSIGEEVVCICELPNVTTRPESAIQIGNTVILRAVQEYPEIPARCGVGLPVTDLSKWRDSFRQAGQALEMSRRLKADQALYFPDLSVNRLLLQLENHPELSAFKDEILGPLLDYDSKEQLIQTLESYFKHNGNLSQAADALFIHRNTLIYRMERIAEITGVDLDKTETRLAVQLALHIHRMGDHG